MGADLKRRVGKLETETEEKVEEGPRGFRVIVSDAARGPLPSDDLCIKTITDEWSSRATAGFVVHVIHLGEIPNDVSPKTERLLLKHGWRHAETLQSCVPGNAPDLVRKQAKIGDRARQG
jgi:hypothetical protein